MYFIGFIGIIILLDRGPPSELDYSLIYRYFLVRLIQISEFFQRWSITGRTIPNLSCLGDP